MEPFPVDKSFYDIGASDLKELWDSDMEPSMGDFKLCEDDWSPGGMLNVKSHVILHDRLMTDAVLSDTPIKSEHSYCSQHSPSASPTSLLIKDELEDDCLLPAVALKTASGRGPSPVPVVIKPEPLSLPSSPASSCPPSPSPPPSSFKTSILYSDMKFHSKLQQGQGVLKNPTVLLTTKSNPLKRKHHVTSNMVKIEQNKAGFSLPPTPPSSTSSDSEGNVSPLHPSSPTRRLFLSASSAPTRQPIQTPLISSQPKGSTGTLLLTEEEKRTLLAEGYAIPVRLPLTKAEEKSLKKIRRKIKNKISAQESRRKKKEYMDALEKRVQLLSSENSDFKKKITTLEDLNSSLSSQVAKLQTIVARIHGGASVRTLSK